MLFSSSVRSLFDTITGYTRSGSCVPTCNMNAWLHQTRCLLRQSEESDAALNDWNVPQRVASSLGSIDLSEHRFNSDSGIFSMKVVVTGCRQETQRVRLTRTFRHVADPQMAGRSTKENRPQFYRSKPAPS